MTKDDIIRMAREAGISKPWDQEPVKWETLGRFAALVYTQGHKDGLDDFEAGVLPAAIKAEREACAEVAEQIEREVFNAVGDPRVSEFKPKIAAAIRARRQG